MYSIIQDKVSQRFCYRLVRGTIITVIYRRCKVCYLFSCHYGAFFSRERRAQSCSQLATRPREYFASRLVTVPSSPLRSTPVDWQIPVGRLPMTAYSIYHSMWYLRFRWLRHPAHSPHYDIPRMQHKAQRPKYAIYKTNYIVPCAPLTDWHIVYRY